MVCHSLRCAIPEFSNEIRTEFLSQRKKNSILLDREEEVNEKNGARSMILHVGEFRIQVTLHHFDPSVRISRHPSDSLLRLLL